MNRPVGRPGKLARFYISVIPVRDKVCLDKAQSHHLQRVLRLKSGAAVELFDGQGNSYLGKIGAFKKGQAYISITRAQPLKRSELEITLASAIPKARRMDWLIEKVSELGLIELIPLVTRYSVVRPKPVSSAGKLTHWRKIAIESAKQSGRNHILQITDILPFGKLPDIIQGYDMKLIAHPEAETSLSELFKIQTKPRHIIYLVGPEGGFSPEEIKATEGLGFRKIRLPCPDILRVETAAVAMLAMLVFALD